MTRIESIDALLGVEHLSDHALDADRTGEDPVRVGRAELRRRIALGDFGRIAGSRSTDENGDPVSEERRTRALIACASVLLREAAASHAPSIGLDAAADALDRTVQAFDRLAPKEN